MSKTISTSTGGYTTSGFTFSSAASSPLTITSTGLVKKTAATGGHAAIYGAGGASTNWTIVNSGQIIGTATGLFGINLGYFGPTVTSAVITNNSGGVIAGQEYGIITDGATTITNKSGGTISANGNDIVFLQTQGTVINYGLVINTNATGLYLQGGGSVINEATGTISINTSVSGIGVRLNAAGTVTNAGTIIGGTGGAVGFEATSTANELIVDPGAVFVGGVDGGTGTVQLASAASAGVLGTFSSSGITNFGTLTFDTGSSWTIKGNATTVTSGGFGNMVMTGFTTTDTIDLLNFTFSGVTTTFGSNALTLSNAASQHATIHIQGAFTGDTFQAAGYAGTTGVQITLGTSSSGLGHTLSGTYNVAVTLTSPTNNPLTVLSSGKVTPTAASRAALYGNSGAAWTIANAGLVNGGSIANGLQLGSASNYVGASVITNQSGGTIEGQYGIRVYNDAGSSITNQTGASIAAIASTLGADSAVYLYGIGTVINAGIITAPTTNSNSRGVLLVNGGAVTNASGGTISGGVGVFLAGIGTVTDAGTIEAGSTTGTALDFASSGANRLIVDPGAVFVGGAVGGSGTLELASAVSAGTLTASGFTGFNVVDFDAGSQWTLAGSTSALTGTISGFTSNDTIDLLGFTATSASYTGGNLTLTNSSSSHVTLHFSGGPFNTGVAALTTNAGGTDITLGTASPTYSWIGGSTNWATPADWASDTVPGTTAVATIANAGSNTVTIVSGESVAVAGLTLAASNTLLVAGTFAPTGAVTVSSALLSIASTGQLTNAHTLTNTGTLIDAGLLTNSGVISGAGVGAVVAVTGQLTNQSGGTIVSTGSAGVSLSGAGSLTNAGSIGGGSNGILASAGGTITNQSGGVISGGTNAISFASGATNRLVIDPGAIFTGTVDAGNTIGATAVSTLELASGASAGTLTSLGSQFINFANETIDAGANWTFTGTNAVTTGVTLTNSGTLTDSGTLTNAGMIFVSGTNTAVSIVSGGILTNAGAGFIAGGAGASNGGAGGTGVYVASGSLTNLAGIAGGNGGASGGINAGAGGIGVNLSSGSLTNQGAISGGIGGSSNTIGGTGGTGGTGVAVASGSLANQGTITGGLGGTDFVSDQNNDGGVGGVGVAVAGAGLIITNQGTILGGAGGSTSTYSLAHGGSNGNGGAGVFFQAGGTLIDAGYIRGGSGASGTADAVTFASGFTNRLVVDPGAVFTGTVDGGNTIGAASISTLELASGASTGTLTGLGTQFINFSRTTIDTGASWTLSGGNTLVSGATLTDAGTLTDSGTLLNAGLITGAPVGVVLTAGAAVTNRSGGTLTGSAYGINANGTGTVVNYGQVAGSATYGIDLAHGGTITDFGSISGGVAAVAFGGTSAGLLILEHGYSLHGVQGSTSASATVELLGTSSASSVTASYNSLGLTHVGTIAFAAGNSNYATLRITNDATLPGTIASFTGAHDTIDLTTLAFVSGSSSAVFNTASHQLTISNGSSSVSLQLGSGSYTGLVWATTVDSGTGTDVVLAAAAPPSISGAVANQAVANQDSITPFSAVSITDPSGDGTITATVTLSATANGTLSNLGSGSYNSTTGVYSVTGAPGAVSTEIDDLVFTPSASTSGVYVTTTGFTIGASGIGGPSSDSTTTVTAVQQVLGLTSVPAGNIVFSVSPDGSSFATATGGKTNEAVVTAPVGGDTYQLPAGYQAEFLGGTASVMLTDNTVDNAVIVGNSGNDTIGAGGANNVSIVGGNGNDTIFGGPGQIAVVAGSGANRVVLPNGATYSATLGGGNDTVFASGSGTISGGTGDNVYAVESVAGSNLIDSNGTDVIYALGTLTQVSVSGNGAQLLGNAGTVDATVTGSAATVAAGGANVNVTTSGSNGLYLEGATPLVLTDNGSNDTVSGGTGAVTVSASTSPLIYGGTVGSSLYVAGGAGTPTVIGGPGSVSVVAGSGGVVVAAGTGTPTVSGLATLFGAAGAATDYIGSIGGAVFAAGVGSETISTANATVGSRIYASASVGTALDVLSGVGTDTVIAGAGTSSITAGTGGVVVATGTGTPTISGAATVFGGADGTTDYIGSVGGVTFGAGNGAETVDATGSSTGNLIFGNASLGSSLLVQGGTGTDTVIGSAGALTVQAAGTDVVAGGSGALTFIGGANAATIYGGAGTASIGAGSGGASFISAGGMATLSGSMTAYGAAGAVTDYVGSVGGVTFYAGAGAETLDASGASTGNIIWAGASSVSTDVLLGGSGNDTLVAGAGTDTLAGGGGSNLFMAIDGRTGGSLTITDFTAQDNLALFSYGAGAAAQALSTAVSTGGNTTLTLSDNTQITFLGVNSTSMLQGHVFST